MFPELVILKNVADLLVLRLRAARADDRGMTTETVIITAVLGALALAATAIIWNKVTNSANNIPEAPAPSP